MDAKTSTTPKTGQLTLGDKSYSFPVYEGTIGPEVLDVSKLYNQTGIFTYDPGFTSTASCESKITYIDGDKGVLLYRGYPIEDLAEHGDFLETCYLLLYGELPTAAQKENFDDRGADGAAVDREIPVLVADRERAGLGLVGLGVHRWALELASGARQRCGRGWRLRRVRAVPTTFWVAHSSVRCKIAQARSVPAI